MYNSNFAKFTQNAKRRDEEGKKEKNEGKVRTSDTPNQYLKAKLKIGKYHPQITSCCLPTAGE